MDGDRVTLMDAFTRFDALVKQYAGESGGQLNDRKKAALDAALAMHAEAAARLKIDPKQAVPDFAPA
jgi:hypothetical protein